jgi:cytochrome c-type biogenesis protein
MTLPAELGFTAFVIALAAGAASFLSPCVLPLVPAYLSFVSGLDLDEARRGNRRVALNAMSFVLGFAIVFTVLGAGFSLAGALVTHKRVLELVAGAVLMAFGLVLVLLAVGLPGLGFLQVERRPFLHKVPKGPSGAVLLGVAFSLGWTPCVGPVLGAILTLAVSGGNPAGGAALLFVYSLGLGIPFILAGLFVGRALRAASWLRRRAKVVQLICGVILVLYGALLVAGQFAVLAAHLSWLHLPSY